MAETFASCFVILIMMAVTLNGFVIVTSFKKWRCGRRRMTPLRLAILLNSLCHLLTSVVPHALYVHTVSSCPHGQSAVNPACPATTVGLLSLCLLDAMTSVVMVVVVVAEILKRTSYKCLSQMKILIRLLVVSVIYVIATVLPLLISIRLESSPAHWHYTALTLDSGKVFGLAMVTYVMPSAFMLLALYLLYRRSQKEREQRCPPQPLETCRPRTDEAEQQDAHAVGITDVSMIASIAPLTPECTLRAQQSAFPTLTFCAVIIHIASGFLLFFQMMVFRDKDNDVSTEAGWRHQYGVTAAMLKFLGPVIIPCYWLTHPQLRC